MAYPPVVRVLSQGGVRWRKFLLDKVAALAEGESVRKMLDGFLLMGKRVSGRSTGVVMDMPVKMLITDSAYNNDTGFVADPLVTISLGRDLFSPGVSIVAQPDKDFSTARLDNRPGLSPEIFFTSIPVPSGVRYVSARGNNGYTGTGAYRGGYVFTMNPADLNLWPFQDPGPLWARSETMFISRKSFLRVGISEATLLAGLGYQFYTRASDNSTYPDSVPIVSCDRRILDDGRDMLVMAIPVVSDTGAYDVDTNNRNYGNAAVFLARFLVTNVAGKPVDVTVVDTFTVGSAGFSTGPLSTQAWANPESPSTPRTGLMPNRLMGDVTLGQDGTVYWGGVWETSREIRENPKTVLVRSLVTIVAPLAGTPSVDRLHTAVITGTDADTDYGYLSLDDDATNLRVPYMQNFFWVAPPGVTPKLVGEVLWLARDIVSGNIARLATSSASALVVASPSAYSFVTIPDGAFFAPDTPIFLNEENTVGVARIAMVDANKVHPKVGLAIRTETDYSTVKWVEYDFATEVVTDRGAIGTVGTGAFQVQPTVTCYQRMESATPQTDNVELKPAGILLTYGIGGVGHTKISKDSGQTWQTIARFAARSAPYYLGSGLTGAALDQMYRAVNDDG